MDAGRLGTLGANLKNRLRDPLQLRVALVVSSLTLWYVAAYMPISGRMDATLTDLTKSEKHLGLVRDIEALRAQAAKFRDRIPSKTDPNEWVEYMLGGIRGYPPLKLLKLESQGMKKHGPFDVMILRIEIQGEFADLDGLLGWIETNTRLFRIDSVTLKPAMGNVGGLVLQLTVLGVMG
jgi:hypothetical protein